MFRDRKEKWKKKIWIAKKIGTVEDDYGHEVAIYDKPVLYKMNVQPVSSETDIQEFGQNAKQMQKAVIELKKYLHEFKEYDIAYLDDVTPFEEGGDFVVDVSDVDFARVRDINQLKVENLATGKLQCYSCEHANYRLYPPRNQNKCIIIYFERLTAK